MASSLLLLCPILFSLVLRCYASYDTPAPTSQVESKYPIVVSTWPFKEAVRAAWNAVDNGLSAVDAVVEGCLTCEDLGCDGTVGPGGSPDENGETTLDAMVMNGNYRNWSLLFQGLCQVTMEVGAVAAMQFVKGAIRAAKLVSEYTQHTLLVGNRASAFALSMGLPGPSNLSSPESLEKWTKWKQSNCEPNFRKNVIPSNGCGPYRPAIGASDLQRSHYACENREIIDKYYILADVGTGSKHISRHNHDTISMAVIDKMGHIAVGTSTNGATFKIPGRVGDGPIAGYAAYADQEAGACGATGDGDVMMRFLPCYQVVESMRQGMTPKDAAVDAISRIKKKYPDFIGAVFALNAQGVHAGACHGWTFQYSVRNSGMEDVEVYTVHPEESKY